MAQLAELSIVCMAIANLALLGSSRLGVCIRAAAAQGIALGLFTLFSHAPDISIHIVVLAAMSIALKGIVFPRLLFAALRRTEQRRELEPIVGYAASILIGVLMLALALWLSSRLPSQEHEVSPVVLPVALWTIQAGLFIVVARRKAITQVLGYLVLENGIFAFGAALATGMPFLVEMGELLDIFAAVFVMGIAIFHINREFDHIDTDRMTALRD